MAAARHFSARWVWRCVRWAITHCPRRVVDHLDRHRLWYRRFVPRWAKEYLKTRVFCTPPDVSLWEQVDRFLAEEAASNSSGRWFLIFSAVTFTDSEGQRATRLARELARRGIPVIFAYWRWYPTTPVQISRFPRVFCLPIDEFLKNYQALLTDPRLGARQRVFLMEYPHPSLLEIVNYANACGWRTVCDVIDDWEEFHKCGQAVWYDPDIETYLLQNAERTTVTCESLRQKMAALGAERLHLLPNAFEDWADGDQDAFRRGRGCTGNDRTAEVSGPRIADQADHAAHGARAPGKSGHSPGDLTDSSREISPARKGRITVGYFGYLTSSWFDWPLVLAVARRRPDWIFQIIGYGLDRRLPACENLVLLGRVRHGNLPAYAKHWDVAMIPFQSSRLARGVDPIKIYEYISLGLPTVVTGLPHLAAYPGVMEAGNDREFEQSVEKAAKAGLDETSAESFLRDNRWANRIDALLDFLDEGIPRNTVSFVLGSEER